MSKNLQDIDKIFRDGLDDHLESAPSGVWDAVNNDLDKKQALLFKEKYYNLKRLAVAALLIIFLGMSGMFYFMNKGKQHIESGAVAGDGAKTKSGNDKTTATKTNDQTNIPNNNTADKSATANNEAVQHADELSTARENVLDKTSATSKDAEDNTPNKNNAAPKNQANISDDNGKNENAEPVNANAKTKAASSIVSHTDVVDSKSVKAKQKAAVEKTQLHSDLVLSENASTKNNRVFNKLNNKQQTPSSKESLFDKNSVASLTNKKDAQQEKLNANKKSQAGNITEELDEKSKTENNIVAIKNVKKVPNPLGPYSYQSPLFIDRIFAPSPITDNANTGSLNKSVALNNKKEEKPTTTAKKGVGNHPIAITVFGSPNHSFIRLKNDDVLATPFRNKNTAEKEETQGGSYSLGVLFSYGLSKKLSLQTGAVYSSATTNISPKTIYARPDNNGHTRYEFNCSWGSSYIDAKSGTAPPAVGDSIKLMGSSSTVSYVGIPVALSYAIRMGRFSVNPAVGFSVNFLTSGEAATRFKMSTSDQKQRAPIEGLKKVYVDGSIGLGAEYAFNKRISLSVRPLLRWALSSTNTNTPIRNYQNFMSVETGLKISL